MPEFQMSIYLETQDGVPWAPDGPGWYIDARKNATGTDPGVEIVPRIRIAPYEAAQIGQVLDNFWIGKELTWTLPEEKRDPRTLKETIPEANAAAGRRMREQLAEAEAAAQRLAELRRRTSEWPDEG